MRPDFTLGETIKGEMAKHQPWDVCWNSLDRSIPFIWDRYYKLDKTHVRSTSGSGIGLSIVKEILDLHKARYGVISSKGKGSTFWFQLPIDKEGNEAE